MNKFRSGEKIRIIGTNIEGIFCQIGSLGDEVCMIMAQSGTHSRVQTNMLESIEPKFGTIRVRLTNWIDSSDNTTEILVEDLDGEEIPVWVKRSSIMED